MRLRSALLLAALSMAAIASTASGHQTTGTDGRGAKCGVPFDPESQRGVVSVVDGNQTLYFDVRAVNEKGYTWSIWIYMEGNGHPGMQTDLSTPSILTGDPVDVDNCKTAGHSTLDPDWLIF